MANEAKRNEDTVEPPVRPEVRARFETFVRRRFAEWQKQHPDIHVASVTMPEIQMMLTAMSMDMNELDEGLNRKTADNGKNEGDAVALLGRWDECPAGKELEPGSKMCRECACHVDMSHRDDEGQAGYVTSCSFPAVNAEAKPRHKKGSVGWLREQLSGFPDDAMTLMSGMDGNEVGHVEFHEEAYRNGGQSVYLM